MHGDAKNLEGYYQHRRNSAAGWTPTRVLLRGEIGVEYSDSPGVPYKFKIGDGVTEWQDLPYANAAGLTDGVKNEITVASSGASFTVTQPQLAAAKVTEKYLSTFASMSSLAATAASNPTVTYIVTVNQTETVDNLVHPSNLYLDFSKGYGVSVNSGQVLQINPPLSTPNHRIFFGLGQVRYKKHPGFKGVDASLYLDDGTVATVPITAAQSEAMRFGVFNNDGGYIWLPVGDYTIDDYFGAETGMTVRGAAHNTYGAGTILRRIGSLADGEGQSSVFRVRGGLRGISFENMVLETTVSGGALVLFRGVPADGNVRDVVFDRITFGTDDTNGGTEGIRIHDPNNTNWQVANVHVKHTCSFVGQTVACIRTNSQNSSPICEAYSYLPAANGQSSSLWLEGGEKVYIDKCDSQAVIPSGYEANNVVKFDFTSSDINTTSNSLTHASADDLETGDSFYLTTTGTLPTNLALNTKFWWNDTNDTIHRNGADAMAGSAPIDLVDGGSGTHTLWSTRPRPEIANQRPKCSIRISGQVAGLTVGPEYRDEGFPDSLIVEDTTPNNPNNIIFLDNPFMQGNLRFNSRVQVIGIGGQYPPESFKDDGTYDYNNTAEITLIGAQPIAWNGPNTPPVNASGYQVPTPARFDDFAGTTVIVNESRRQIGHMFRAPVRGEYITGIEVQVPDAPPWGVWRKIKGVASGLFLGWWQTDNSYTGNDDQYAGEYVKSHFANHGVRLNTKPLATSGTATNITLDLRDTGDYHVTPTGNAAIQFSNARNDGSIFSVGFYALKILTSGTTSYNLTAGTNVHMLGTFATGTASGVYYTLLFYHDGVRLIEIGRAQTAAGSIATDTLWDAKGDLVIGTGADTAARLAVGANDTFPVADSTQSTGVKWTNSILELFIRGALSGLKFYNRATDALSIQLYSPTARKLSCYDHPGSANLFSVDNTEFRSYVDLKQNIDSAYDETGWNGSVRCATENAVRDKIYAIQARGDRISSDSSWTSNTTLSTAGLEVTLPVGEYQMDVQFVATVGAGGLKTDFSGTAVIGSGSRLFGSSHQLNVDEAVFTPASWVDPADDINWGTETGDRAIRITGAINVTTAGTFILRAAQQSSNGAATTIYTGGSGIFTPLYT